MSEEQAKNGEEGQSKNIFDDLVEKTKVFADKASDIIEENIDKLKQSETYGKVTDFVEKQTEAYKSGEMEAKFSEMKENAGKKGEEFIEQARSVVNLLADDVEEAIGKVKNKMAGKDDSRPNNQV
jgi:glutamyl-tRNA reductase